MEIGQLRETFSRNIRYSGSSGRVLEILKVMVYRQYGHRGTPIGLRSGRLRIKDGHGDGDNVLNLYHSIPSLGTGVGIEIGVVGPS
jgi:hypothetical protein